MAVIVAMILKRYQFILLETIIINKMSNLSKKIKKPILIINLKFKIRAVPYHLSLCIITNLKHQRVQIKNLNS